MKKRLISSMLAAGVLFNASGVLAAQGDVYLKEKLDEAKYTALEMFEDKNKLNILGKEDKFGFEGRNGKIYSMEDANEAWREAKSYVGTLDLLEKKYKAINEKEEDLKVESISAINQTVDKSATLKFKINGEKEVTAADIKEAGYEVTFKASEAVFAEGATSKTGKLAIAEVKKDHKFQYEVEVKDKDGKVIKSEERGTVTVENQSAMVEEMSAVIKKDEAELENLVLDFKGEYDLAVTGKTKNMKAEDKAKDLDPELYTVKSSTIGVVSVDENNKLTANAKGKATITIAAKEGTAKDVVLEVEVKDAAKVSVEKSEVKLEKNEISTDETTKLTLNLKDENGNVVAGKADEEEDYFSLKDAKLVELGTIAEDSKVKGTYTLEVKGLKKGTEKLVLVADGVEIEVGEITVKEAKDEIAEYKLVVDGEDAKAEFDLKGKKDDDTLTLNLKAEGYDDQGLLAKEQPKIDGNAYRLVSKNEKVVEIKNNNEVTLVDGAKAGDKAIVELHKKTGALEDKVAEIEISVVDTTPVLKDVKFTQHPEVTEAGSIDLDKILEVTAEGSKGEVKVAYTVNDDKKSLNIVEATKDAAKDASTEALVLGKVELKNTPKGLGVSLNEKEGKASIEVKMVDQTASEDDSPQPAQNKGSFNLAVIDKGGNFKGDTTVDVNITKVKASADSLKAIKAYGLGEDINDGKKVNDTSKVTQVPQSLEDVAKFLDIQYGATLNTENIVAKGGKIEITGKLLSSSDFTKIKGNKDGAYRLTIEDVAKIAISEDGTAVFEALK